MGIRWHLALLWVLVWAAAPAGAQTPQVGGGNIATAAGTGTPGFTGDGGPGSQAALTFVVGNPDFEDDFGHLAVDKDGTLYIADKGNHVIRKVAANGVITTIAGTAQKTGFGGDGGPATRALLNFPTGIALDPAGNLYVTDEDNNRVRKIDKNGVITTVAGTDNPTNDFGGDGGPATSAKLNGPSAVAVDAAGNIYIADTFNDRVRVVSAQNGVITTIAGTGRHSDEDPGRDAVLGTQVSLGWPSGLVVDDKGNLFISDHHNNVVRVLNLQTGLIRRIAGTGVHNDDFAVFPYSGDNGPATQAALGYPMGLALDKDGSLWVADMHNDAIRRISSPLTGPATITTPVSLALNGFDGDNAPAWNAKLSRPTGLGIDPSGNLFVADWYNQRVRKVAPGTSTPAPFLFPGGVVNGASFAPAPARVAPGSIISIFGRRLATGTATASVKPLPITLLNPPQQVSVSAAAGSTAIPMPLFFVSPDQINAQLPAELPTSGSATVTAKVGDLSSAPLTINLSPSETGIFLYGSNRAVAQNQDGTLNSGNNPAARGSTIVVYLTGQGGLNPPVPTGQPAPFDPLSPSALDKSAIIGNVLAQVTFLGATPGFVGLSQANIVVPDNAPTGDQPLALNVGGHDSNRPVISIK